MRLIVPLLVLLAAAPASAQLRVGGQIGSPTGLALKLGDGRGAVMIGVGWDLDDAVEAEAHYLLRDRRRAGGQTDVRVFYGPGAFVQSNDNNTNAGISLGLGLSADLTPEIDLFGMLSPRLQLVEETDIDLGAALGLRLAL
jgi:hypothetical protein